MMKAVAASSIGPYEKSVRALAYSYRTVSLGLSIFSGRAGQRFGLQSGKADCWGCDGSGRDRFSPGNRNRHQSAGDKLASGATWVRGEVANGFESLGHAINALGQKIGSSKKAAPVNLGS